jgi:hypothetical protein
MLVQRACLHAHFMPQLWHVPRTSYAMTYGHPFLFNFLAVVFACLTAETEPGLSMPEMGKRCGEMWRELSEEDWQAPNGDQGTTSAAFGASNIGATAAGE